MRGPGLDVFVIFVLSFGPPLLIYGLAYGWSRLSRVDLLAKSLSWASIILVLLSFILAVSFAVAALSCDGSPSIGLHNCTLVSDWTVYSLRNAVTWQLSLAFGFMWLVIGGGGLTEVVSWIKARRQDS